MLNIGWWTTGRDEMAVTLLKEMITAIKNMKLNVKIDYVFLSQKIDQNQFCTQITKLCQKEGINILSLSTKEFLPELRKSDYIKWRDAYHDEVLRLIKDFNSSLVVLAGYMWIVSSNACDSLNIINLHPALPNGPTGTWQEVIWKLIEENADYTGVMMHLVTPELDRGPAVTYCKFPIKGNDWDELWNYANEIISKHGFNYLKNNIGENLPLFKKIREEGTKREIPLIIHTVKAFSEGKIQIKEKKLIDNNNNPLDKPYLLDL